MTKSKSMMLKNSQKIVSEHWFKNFVQDCVDRIEEAGKRARWELIVAYHQVGVDIIKKAQEKSLSLSEFVPYVMATLEKGDRTIRYCIQLADRHPKLNNEAIGQMEGALVKDYGSGTSKEPTWRWIVNRYLPEAYKDPEKRFTEHEHEAITICKICHLKLE